MFRAVVRRDTRSLERDDNDQAYFEMNRLDTAAGRPMCEVLFADGMWLQADPTTDLLSTES